MSQGVERLLELPDADQGIILAALAVRTSDRNTNGSERRNARAAQHLIFDAMRQRRGRRDSLQVPAQPQPRRKSFVRV